MASSDITLTTQSFVMYPNMRVSVKQQKRSGSVAVGKTTATVPVQAKLCKTSIHFLIKNLNSH